MQTINEQIVGKSIEDVNAMGIDFGTMYPVVELRESFMPSAYGLNGPIVWFDSPTLIVVGTVDASEMGDLEIIDDFYAMAK